MTNFTPFEERAMLVNRQAHARTRLDVIQHDKRTVSADAANGDQAALATFIALEKAEVEAHRAVELLENALAAYDARRDEAAAAKHAKRVAVGNARRAAILDAMEKEQRADIMARIAVLKAQGDTAQVEVWTAQLDVIRQNLETAMPPIGTKPKGKPFVIGVPDAA
jgi:hypothetical protein